MIIDTTRAKDYPPSHFIPEPGALIYIIPLLNAMIMTLINNRGEGGASLISLPVIVDYFDGQIRVLTHLRVIFMVSGVSRLYQLIPNKPHFIL